MTQQLAPTAPPADLSQEIIDFIIDSPDITAADAAHLRVCPRPNNIMGIGCDRPVHDILAAEQERQIWADINPPDPRPLVETLNVDGCECGCHPNYETAVRRAQRTGYLPPADPDDTSHLGCYYCQ